MEPTLHIQGCRIRRERGGFVFQLLVPHMSVAPGEFVAVIGESGCGKSTLLDILALVTQPDACEAFTLNGREGPVNIREPLMQAQDDMLSSIRGRYLGYILQRGGLLPFLTLEQNVALAGRIAGVSDLAERTEHLVKGLGIADRLSFKPKDLSGGQRQRAAIARAIVHEPSIILADEPTAAVDETRAHSVIGALHHEAKARGAAVIVVTHHKHLVLPIADTVYGFELESRSPNHVISICGPLVESLKSAVQ